jgi:hypothetical protein
VTNSIEVRPTAPRHARQIPYGRVWRRSLVRGRRNATTLLFDEYSETVKNIIDAIDAFDGKR